MEDLRFLLNNLMMAFISSFIIFTQTGYISNVQCMSVYCNTTMPVTLTFNNTGDGNTRSIFKDGGGIVWHFPSYTIVAPNYTNRLTYNVTSKSFSITIMNTTSEDAGMYVLINTFLNPERDMFQIQLYIMGIPLTPMLIIERNGTVGGDKGSMRCNTTSTSKPSGLNFTYTWRTDTGIIEKESNKYTFERKDRFTLLIVVDRNETLNNYTCSATELYGLTSQLSSSMILQPDRSPLVRMKPESSVVREIEFRQTTLECLVTDGKPKKYTYQWWKDGINLDRSSTLLSISNVTRSNSGQYNCSVSNTIEPAGKGDALLVVLYGPTVTCPDIMSGEDGQNLTISCQIESNPQPSDANVTWLRPANSTFNRTDLKLEIPNLNREDNGTFLTIVRITLQPTYGDSMIQSSSATVNVNVLYGPIINHINNQSLEEGKEITMFCNSQSNPSATNEDVTWTKQGNYSFHQTGPKLYIPSLDRIDLGTFVCLVNITLRPTHGPAVVRSALGNFHLNVLYGPTITKMKPYSQVEGKNITIDCEIQSNPASTNGDVHWTKQGNTSFKQPGHRLFLQYINRKDEGTFVCHVSIQLQPTDRLTVVRNNTETVKINVLYGPIIKTMFNQSLEEGDNVIADCIVRSNPTVNNGSVTWNKQGNSSFNQRGLQLKIPAVDRMDYGIFICSVEITFMPSDGLIIVRNDTESLLLNVKYQPNITYLGLITEDVFEGNETTALCQADGNPMPFITWVYLENNTEINNNSRTIHLRNNISSQLKLGSARCEDTGTYMCQATNGIMSPSNRTVQIYVKCKPRLSSILNEGQNITVGRNESLSYTVMFHAFPKPTFEWTFNGTTLTGFNVSTLTENLHYKSGSRIQKAEITDNDIGLYEVIAKNQFGRGNASFYIIFQREPDQPLLLSHSCIDRPKSAKIEWMAGKNGGLDQRFIIQYKKETDEYFQDAEKEIAEDNTREIYLEFIDNLIGGLTYIFRVNALNAKGRSVSVEVNCTVVDFSKSNNSLAVTTIIVVVSTVLVLSLLVAVGGVLIFKRQTTKKNDKQLIKRTGANNKENDDEDGLKDNPMYVSSGPTAIENDKGAIYSVVQKTKKTGESKEIVTKCEQSVYAEVLKSNKKGKGSFPNIKSIKTKKTGEKKDKSFEMGCVYENSEDIKNINEGDVYANSNTDDQNKYRKIYQPTKNKDGLIYADLDLAPGPSGNCFVIRGIENRSNYAIIDLTKKAEPLPSDRESEYEKQSTEKEESFENQYK